ncbi:MAG: CvpA family protein [Candidatus Omnitrophota bacterium]
MNFLLNNKMASFFKNLNWIDILVLTIILRTSYIGLRRGFVIEFFKGIGLFFGLFISLHYYSKLTEFLNKLTPVPADFLEPLVLLSILILIVLGFKFIRDAILLLFKIEPKTYLDRWGGAFLGIVRSVLVASLVLLGLVFFPIDYFKKSIFGSTMGVTLVKVAPRVYESSFENFFRLFFPQEELNKAIFIKLEKKESPKKVPQRTQK